MLMEKSERNMYRRITDFLRDYFLNEIAVGTFSCIPTHFSRSLDTNNTESCLTLRGCRCVFPLKNTDLYLIITIGIICKIIHK